MFQALLKQPYFYARVYYVYLHIIYNTGTHALTHCLFDQFERTEKCTASQTK